MASGVSHGSAPPAGVAAATGSNAISAKLGMRVIPWRPQTFCVVRSALERSSRTRDLRNGFSAWPEAGTGRTVRLSKSKPRTRPASGAKTSCDPSTIGVLDKQPNPSSMSSITVWMLVADDAVELVRPVVLQRGLARQIGDGHHPAEPGFGAELLGRHHPVRAVECAGHDLDPPAVDAAKAERRAAVCAEIALGDGGGAERGWLAAGPGEIAEFNVGEGCERRTGRLLAHPAVTDADLHRRRRQRKAYGAALAAVGQNGFRRRCHAHSVSR